MAHLVWDWNGTLLNDLHLVVNATNDAFASVGGRALSVDEHRREFARPISDFYSRMLERQLSDEEFAQLDNVFHESYRTALINAALADDVHEALDGWSGSQSLLSMWFHRELVPTVTRFGLYGRFARVDGLRDEVGGFKAGYLKMHLTELGIDGQDAVMIGDSIDDADAAAAVGARCVLYSGGFTAPEALHAYGVPVAHSLREAVALALAR